MQNTKYSEFNGKLFALFFFQFSILIPFTQFMDIKILVAFVSGIISLLLLLKNKILVFKKKVLLLYLCLVLLFLVKYLLGQANGEVILFSFAYITPVVWLFLFPFNRSCCVKAMFFLSKINFLLLVTLPFTTGLAESYMRFGYGMLPSVIMSFVELAHYSSEKITTIDLKEKCIEIFDLIIILIGGLEMLIYGARGSTFAFLLFVVIDYLIFKKVSLLYTCALFLFSLFLYSNLEFILDYLERITNRLGIFSYAIFKFKAQLMYGFDSASSGRAFLYTHAINEILQYPIFGGTLSTDEVYVHNLFLQVGTDFGVFAIIILILFTLYVLYLIGKKDIVKEEKLLLLIFFSLSYGRLMFSSTIWQRPEFWILVFFVLSLERYKKTAVNC